MEIDGDNDIESQYVRSMADVKSMIAHAKLNEKNLTETTQTLYFAASTDETDYKLLELNSHILSAIENGEDLYFKGGLSEKVVLCTNTKTFEIKEAEISNSLLLVADLKLAQATSTSPLKSAQGAVNRSLDKSSDSMNDSSENNVADDAENTDVTRHLEQRNVLKVFHEYLECREIKPRFSKLYELLCISRYTGLENEYCIDRSVLFTRQQLINTIQCSPAEFDEGLQRFRVIEIDGRQRMLECEYEYRIVSLMLGIIAEMAWRLDEIDRDETVELLAPNIAPEQIVRGLFDLYAIETPGKTNKEGKPLYGYSELMVCRIVAQNILQQGTKFHMDDFMSTWQDALPDGMKINETYLRGIGIIDRDSSSVPCVRSLIESNLPINLQNRLKMLFRTKDKWTLDQIEPYIEYFVTPQLTVTSILAKHARTLTVNNQRLYVSKHGL